MNKKVFEVINHSDFEKLPINILLWEVELDTNKLLVFENRFVFSKEFNGHILDINLLPKSLCV